jgi:hypothetical protein
MTIMTRFNKGESSCFTKLMVVLQLDRAFCLHCGSAESGNNALSTAIKSLVVSQYRHFSFSFIADLDFGNNLKDKDSLDPGDLFQPRRPHDCSMGRSS